MKLLFWNIDQARAHEKDKQTCWDTRSEAVKSLIVSCDADIIGLVELRDLETSSESARKFLSDPRFLRYDVVSRRYCHFAVTFQMALLFDPTKFFLGDVRVHSYLGKPENDKIVMFVDLQSKSTLNWFTVGVTHFDLPEDVKWTSVRTLRPLLASQKYPCLVYGDYNFFNDLEGKEQRAFMLEEFYDLAHPLQSALGPLNGTFVGFSIDPNKQSFEKPSRLDHIFSANMRGTCTSPFVDQFCFDNSTLDSYTYPSDHLALLLQIPE